MNFGIQVLAWRVAILTGFSWFFSLPNNNAEIGSQIRPLLLFKIEIT